MNKIFNYTNYKTYLIDLINLNQGIRGYQGQMAKAAKCSPSYFSLALKGNQDLTPDQGMNIAVYLSFSNTETAYFMGMINHARAGSQNLKKYLESELIKLKASQENLSERITHPKPSREIESIYYSSWMWAAVHMVTSSPDYQTVDKISKRLDIKPERLQVVLEGLRDMGLIENVDGFWKYKTGAHHLPHNSHYTEINHSNWRQKAITDVQKGDLNSVHYSSVFTMTASEYYSLKSFVLSMIEESRSILGPSEPEELYCFNCDLFKI